MNNGNVLNILRGFSLFFKNAIHYIKHFSIEDKKFQIEHCGL